MNFCRIDRFDEHDPDLRTGIVQFLVSDWSDIIGFQEQFQPVTGFVGFFQCDLQFGDEIRLPMCILRFMDIGADAGSRSADLVGNNGFSLIFSGLSPS